MGDLPFVAAAIVWGLLPGLALLHAVDPDWSAVERVAAAAGISLAVVAFSAYGAELAGLPVAPTPVLILVALFCGVVFLLRRWLPRAAAAEGHAAEMPDARPSWAPWLVLLLPLAIVSRLEPVSTLPLLPPSLHDGLDHANWFRLIYETRSLNPHDVLAPPLGPDGTPTYYPWGLHAWLALVAHTSRLDPVAVLMQGMVLVSAVLPLSIYAFTAHLLGRGWTAVAAAALSLGFWWLPYQVWSWGGYPLLAGAVAALPLCRLALWAVERLHLAGLAAATVCGLGVLVIHPSQAMLALIVACVTGTTLAGSRALPWRAALPFMLLFALVGVVLSLGAGVWEPIGAFMETARVIGAEPSRDPRFAWPMELYFGNRVLFPIGSRVTFAALCAIGGAFAVVQRRARPFLVLHVVLSLLVPFAQHLTWLTGLWYHLPERLWYAQYASLPALAAVGIAGLLGLLAGALRRWIDLARWQYVTWPLALYLAMAIGFGRAYDTWEHTRLRTYALRNPNLTITDRRVLADFDWIRAHVPAGEILFNAPADWGLPLPFTGHRTVYWSGGYAIDPTTNWNRLLNLLRRGDPFASHAAAELAGLGVRYIYAASLDEALQDLNRQPLEPEVLRDAAAFEVLYESPTATILRVREEGGHGLGLRDSDRILFEGFYPIETLNGREWRWTMGHGRLQVTGPPSGECFLRVLGSDPDAYVITLGERTIELTPLGFRLPAGLDEPGRFEIEIGPAPGHAPQAAPGDPRDLGVRVTDVWLACPGRPRSSSGSFLRVQPATLLEERLPQDTQR
jgi:hypothetical protein